MRHSSRRSRAPSVAVAVLLAAGAAARGGPRCGPTSATTSTTTTSTADPPPTEPPIDRLDVPTDRAPRSDHRVDRHDPGPRRRAAQPGERRRPGRSGLLRQPGPRSTRRRRRAWPAEVARAQQREAHDRPPGRRWPTPTSTPPPRPTLRRPGRSGPTAGRRAAGRQGGGRGQDPVRAAGGGRLHGGRESQSFALLELASPQRVRQPQRHALGRARPRRRRRRRLRDQARGPDR